MEERYYIPDISEFKAGFEFESCTKSVGYGLIDLSNLENIEPKEFIKVWTKEIFSINHLDIKCCNYIFYMVLVDNRIRVKYLDSEDIISLGFNFSHDVYVKNCGDRLLSLVIKDDKIRICEMSNSDKYKVLFYGKIKNKSELKDILEKI